MKKIKEALDRRVRSAEWTDSDTWNVLDRIRKSREAPEKRRLSVMLPAAAVLGLVLCISMIALISRQGNPDRIRDSVQTAEPSAVVLSAAPMTYEETVRNNLKEAYPEIADELIPLNLTCERDGIRLEVQSALMKGQDVYILFSFQDLEGDRISRYVFNYAVRFLDDTGTVCINTGHMLLGFSREERKVTCIQCFRYGAPVPPEDSTVTAEFTELRYSGTRTVDLLPLLKQYGSAAAESTEMPESSLYHLSYDEGRTVAPEVGTMKILDNTRPLDVPLYKTISLAGIGWIDGRLHIQIRSSDPRKARVDRVSVFCRSDAGGEENERITDTLVWGFNDDSLPEWAELIADVSPDEADAPELSAEITELAEVSEDKWEIKLPLSRIYTEDHGETAVSCEEAIRARLEQEVPEIMDELKPVNLSFESQGIRVEIISALVKGNESWAVYSLQDLEGSRIAGTDDYRIYDSVNDSDDIGYTDTWGYITLYTSAEEHKAVYLRHTTYDGMNQPEDGMYTFCVDSIYTTEHETVDLKPLLKQYGATVEGIQSPEGTSLYFGGWGGPTPQGQKFLDYTHPLDIPLGSQGNTLLTGIGWIDGELHVQIHEDDSKYVKVDGYTTYRLHYLNISNISYDGYFFAHAGSAPYDWGYSENDWDSWREYVFDSAPEDVPLMKLTAELSMQTDMTIGNWEVKVPVSMILAEE